MEISNDITTCSGCNYRGPMIWRSERKRTYKCPRCGHINLTSEGFKIGSHELLKAIANSPGFPIGAHLNDKEIADLISGTSSEESRNNDELEVHYTSCDNCLEKLNTLFDAFKPSMDLDEEQRKSLHRRIMFNLKGQYN